MNVQVASSSTITSTVKLPAGNDTDLVISKLEVPQDRKKDKTKKNLKKEKGKGKEKQHGFNEKVRALH